MFWLPKCFLLSPFHWFVKSRKEDRTAVVRQQTLAFDAWDLKDVLASGCTLMVVIKDHLRMISRALRHWHSSKYQQLRKTWEIQTEMFVNSSAVFVLEKPCHMISSWSDQLPVHEQCAHETKIRSASWPMASFARKRLLFTTSESARRYSDHNGTKDPGLLRPFPDRCVLIFENKAQSMTFLHCFQNVLLVQNVTLRYSNWADVGPL